MAIRDFISMVETLFPDKPELDEAEPYLVPAVKHIETNRIFRGVPGDMHHNVAERNGFFGVDWKHHPEIQLGFVNHKGHFLDRARALEYAQEHDMLHDMARRYIAKDDTPAELGASFLKKH